MLISVSQGGIGRGLNRPASTLVQNVLCMESNALGFLERCTHALTFGFPKLCLPIGLFAP